MERPLEEREEARQDWAIRIGRMVREARLERGLAVKTLAHQSGVYAPNITRIEHGCNEPRLETLELLARAMGLRLVIRLEEPYEG